MSELLNEARTSDFNLVLDASPEECVDLRYHAISLIDAAVRGDVFEGLKVDVITGAGGEKRAVFSFKHDKTERKPTISLAYRHDGGVEMYFGQVIPAEFHDVNLIKLTYCRVDGDKAEVSEKRGLAFAATLLPVEKDKIAIKDLSAWHQLLTDIGEPRAKDSCGRNRTPKLQGLVGKLAWRS